MRRTTEMHEVLWSSPRGRGAARLGTQPRWRVAAPVGSFFLSHRGPRQGQRGALTKLAPPGARAQARRSLGQVTASGVKSMWKGLLRTAVLLQHSQNFEIGPWTNSSLLISIRLEVIGDLIRRLKSAGRIAWLHTSKRSGGDKGNNMFKLGRGGDDHFGTSRFRFGQN